MLLKVGTKVGLDSNELNETLIRRTMFKKIEENKLRAEKDHVLGVPTFIFGKFPVNGVQTLDPFRKII